jgi:hypothetical protein
MTAGHVTSDDTPVNQPPLDQVLQIALLPQIARQLIAAPVIIEDFDCPNLGGSSTQSLIRIFVDRTIAKARPTLKRTKLRYEQWRSSIALHEQFEVILHQLLGLQYDAPGFKEIGPIRIPNSAHGFATGLEHWYVAEQLHADPALYEKDLAEFIDESEVEDITEPPPDLACFPYVEAPDARDVLILQRLAKLGVADAMHHPVKLSHEAVGYGPGHGKEFCRTCEHSDHKAPPTCELVVDIEPAGWCRLWTKT